MKPWKCFWVLAVVALAACSKPASKSEPDETAQTRATKDEPGEAPASIKAGGPDDVATGFYTVYLTLPVGGVPTADARAKLEPYISETLEELLVEASAAEAHHDAATKGQEPPLLEGDPFTSLFEGATAFDPPKCTSGPGAIGTCKVALTHTESSGAPVRWSDTVDLIVTDGNWTINDIEYGGTGGDFGNKGRLTDVLKSVIADAPHASH